jgi:hypothetical protein
MKRMEIALNLDIDEEMKVVIQSLKECHKDIVSNDLSVLPAIETVLRYYMLPDDFNEWKRSL